MTIVRNSEVGEIIWLSSTRPEVLYGDLKRMNIKT